MSLMIFKAFICADIGSLAMLSVLVNMCGIDSKTASDTLKKMVGYGALVLYVGTVISGTTALFWWWVG